MWNTQYTSRPTPDKFEKIVGTKFNVAWLDSRQNDMADVETVVMYSTVHCTMLYLIFNTKMRYFQ